MTRTVAEPRLAVVASWASILCSFILSAETWVKLAELAGFGTRTSWAMVGVVDAYVISALVLWMVSTDPKLAAFAKKNTYAAALVGVAAQSGYHAWTAAGSAVVVVILALVIGALPPAFAALGIHMRALGLLSAKTSDNGKLTAGRLELSLIHGAADTMRQALEEMNARLAAAEAAQAVTATPAPVVDSAPAVTATPEPTVTVDPVTVPATPKPRAARTGGSRAAILAWLTDNVDADVAKIRAQFPGVSDRTAFRALADFRSAATA